MKFIATFIYVVMFSSLAFTKSFGDTCNAEHYIENSRDKNLQFLNTAVNQVQKLYVNDIDKKMLVEGAIQGMLSSLDPHSMYLDEKSYRDMQSIVHGEFGGLAIEISIERGMAIVISPYENGPAFKAGIKSGDAIIKIDDESIESIGLANITSRLRGAPNTTVKLLVLRDGEQLEFDIKRELIKIVPVKSSLLSGGTISYIKISGFNSKTAAFVNESLIQHIGHNPDLDGVILDLRWNPGGLLEDAVAVANLFLQPGQNIVSVRSRNQEFNKEYVSNINDAAGKLPVVILINGGSASAAEVVAGALQDHKRALVLGTQSFGKGSVQTIFPLGNNAAMKLTTALYYTPSGKCIQASGIQPNILVEEGVVVKSTRARYSSESSLRNHIKRPSALNEENKVAENVRNKKAVVMENVKSEKVTHSANTDASDADDIDLRNQSSTIQLEAGDESTDFQLLRAIDIIKTAVIYNHDANKQEQDSKSSIKANENQ